MQIEVDGEKQAPISINEPALLELTKHPHHESHVLRLQADPDLRIWSVSFAAGVP